MSDLIYCEAPRLAVLGKHKVLGIKDGYLDADVGEGFETEAVFHEPEKFRNWLSEFVMRHWPHRSPASPPSWQEENKKTKKQKNNTSFLVSRLKYLSMIVDFKVKG